MSLHPVLSSAHPWRDDLSTHFLPACISVHSIHPSIYLPPPLSLLWRASFPPLIAREPETRLLPLASSSNPRAFHLSRGILACSYQGLPEAHCHRTYQRRLKAALPADGAAARGSGVGSRRSPPPPRVLTLPSVGAATTGAPAGAAAAAPVASVRSSGAWWATAQSPGVVQGPAGLGPSSPARRAWEPGGEACLASPARGGFCRAQPPHRGFQEEEVAQVPALVPLSLPSDSPGDVPQPRAARAEARKGCAPAGQVPAGPG